MRHSNPFNPSYRVYRRRWELIKPALCIAFVGAVIAALLWWLMPDPDPDQAVNALKVMGFSDIQVGEPESGVGPCSEDDIWAYPAMAKNPAGQHVHLVVCCGTYKACTVRVP